MTNISNSKLLDLAADVINAEADGVSGLIGLLDENFCQIVNVISNTKGKVIVSGMGKSGIIGTKIAATFASTGTPSFFMHPGEAFHGDLGMICKEDVLLMLSYSGETEEIIRLLPYAKEHNIFVASITGDVGSTLAINSNNHICASVAREACPLQLAPTTSTTAALVVGDAIAVALMEVRNFKPENFAKYHPGGSLGRRLLLKVKDIMFTDNLPVIRSDSFFYDLIEAMTNGNLGVVVVEDGEKRIKGLVSSGDMLRALRSNKGSSDILIEDIMTKEPVYIEESSNIEYAEKVMKKNEITCLLIQEKNRLKGLVHISKC